MAPRRAYVRRNAGDNVEREYPQVLVDTLVKQVTNTEFRVDFQVLAHAMTTQVNREVVVPKYPNVGTTTTRVRDFTRMNPLEFHGSKVKEDSQEFIDDMTTQRDFARRNEGDNVDQEALPQAPQALVDPLTEQVTNVEFKAAFLVLAQAVMAQANREVVVLLNPNVGSNACFGCGKKDHKIRHYPSVAKNEGDSNRRAQPYLSSDPSGSGVSGPKQKRLYAFQTRGEQEGSPDVVTGPFSVSTPVGDSVVAKRVYRRRPLSLSHRVSLVDLVELDMLDFDVILGMDWLHSFYASIDCRNRVVKFQFPNKPMIEWKVEILCLKFNFFPTLKLKS
uniref:Gag-pol protein n=1 Tax=Solanum tuberosum TaxID=4113 RepID=M1DHJ3_SOLTU